jgi:predicted porin
MWERGLENSPDSRRKQEDGMRKYLLAGVATLGAAGFAGTAFAQAPAAPVMTAPPTPTEGMVATTPAAAVPGANNNNNYQAAQLPGPTANPTPGTIVVRVNGLVEVDFLGTWSSADTRLFTAPAGTNGGATISPGTAGGIVGAAGVNSGATGTAAALGTNGVGPAKVAPQDMESFGRLYFGADGMATNGLRYGAAIEIRENFGGEASGTSASTYSSSETLFVRRAFTYVAGANWGIVRVGQADGLISIFDNGVTTFQFLPTGNLNGGDLNQQVVDQNAAPGFFFLGQAGAEYGNTKAVYLSPQIAGFDFGLQYAPNTSNGFGIGSTAGGIANSFSGSGIGTGFTCTTATSGCPTTSSGPGALDGARIINQTAVGLRYQGIVGGVGVLAYGVYEFSGIGDYTGAQVGPIGSPTGPGTTNVATSQLGITGLPGSRYTGHYQPLNFGSGGIALTFGGFTVGGNVIGGAISDQLFPTPKGGTHEFAYLLGAKYVAGPWTVGIVGEEGTYQGAVQLAGITQRRARAIDTGVSYAVAPGYTVYAEYMYEDQYQGDFNMTTGAVGSNANNEARAQGFLIGNAVRF